MKFLLRAHHIYENLKNAYGSSNCHLLQINSKQPSSSTGTSTNPAQPDFDPWLQYCKYNELLTNSTTSTLLNTPIIGNIQPGVDNNILHPLSQSASDDPSLSNNDVPATPPKRHGMYLAPSDHDRIKTFISEFLQRGLVPYAERTIRILNEQIQSKRSILKSFSIPRRIFGLSSSSGSSSSLSSNSKSAANAASVSVSAAALQSAGSTTSTGSTVSSMNGSPVAGSGSNLVNITSNFINANDDLLMRRLADLSFMFRLYDLAYSSYHSCKKEFSSVLNSSSVQSNSEQLLNMSFYYAGALEMASIASFMQNFANDHNYQSSIASSGSNSASSASLPVSGSSTSISSMSSNLPIKQYNSQYIEEAIQIYLNSCKNIYFATRSTLLSTEALKLNSVFQKAALHFHSLPTDDADIRNALFLEQAALCYLAIQPVPLIRKYAYFMSMAGYKFNKSGHVSYYLKPN